MNIDQNGKITGNITVNNGGEVKFKVSQYPNGMNTCTISISSSNVTWGSTPVAGQNTIKVGQGG